MNRSFSLKRTHSFNAHESHRLRELDGIVLAPFWRRAVALCLDLIGVVLFSAVTGFLVLVVVAAVNVLIGRPTSYELNIGQDFFENHYAQFGVAIGYFGLVTYISNGQTLGKHIMNIRILSTVHERLSLWQSIERGLGYLASMLEFGFGFVQFFINPNRRCVHDRIAETIVVQVTTTRTIDR